MIIQFEGKDRKGYLVFRSSEDGEVYGFIDIDFSDKVICPSMQWNSMNKIYWVFLKKEIKKGGEYHVCWRIFNSNE